MMARSLLLAVVVLLTLGGSLAWAGPEQASVMMDDDQLLYRGDRTRARSLVAMKNLGVDAVRVTVLWKVVAEGASLSNKEIGALRTGRERDRARAQRSRFRAADPRTYPSRNWDRYDNLVKEATDLGLRVYFTLTGPGPHYGHERAPASQRLNAGTYRPVAARFGEFAEAVGRRYSGTYRDENAIRRPLARVSTWSIWNEPNQPGWLTPQSETRDGQLVPTAPAIYRGLYRAGVAGLERSGHSTATDGILLGETAPLGSDRQGPRNGLGPVAFLRELVCVAADGTPYGGADAARRDCDFAQAGPLAATGYAHHPYTKQIAPTRLPARPDAEITIANIATLGPLLDTLSTQSGGGIAAGLPVILTEFGYESNPPDPRNGIAPLRQAEFNQLAEFLAYNDPRVQATTQFLLRDVGPATRYPKDSRLYWFTYQSGLLTAAGKTKPAAFAYALPLVVYTNPDATIGYWGQLRFRPNGQPDVAVLMWRPTPTSPWQQLGEPIPTTPAGYFSGTTTPPDQGGEYRAVYVNPDTTTITHSSLPAKP